MSRLIAGANKHLENWQRKAFVHWLTTGFIFGNYATELLKYGNNPSKKDKTTALKAMDATIQVRKIHSPGILTGDFYYTISG